MRTALVQDKKWYMGGQQDRLDLTAYGFCGIFPQTILSDSRFFPSVCIGNQRRGQHLLFCLLWADESFLSAVICLSMDINDNLGDGNVRDLLLAGRMPDNKMAVP